MTEKKKKSKKKKPSKEKSENYLIKITPTFLEPKLVDNKSLVDKKNNLTKIIQVGANEGTKSDYLNNVLKTYGENISVLFIEPQLNLKNVLIKNTKSLCKKTDYAFVAINSNKLSSLELFIPNQSIFPRKISTW